MEPLIIILLLAFVNSTKNKISFRFDYTLWSKLKADRWFNPAVSWHNKHEWNPSWLFKTALVWVTDFWHFLKFIELNMIFITFILLKYNEFVWQPLLVYWGIWGLLFEANYRFKWTR
jgi:hypothetical protein